SRHAERRRERRREKAGFRERARGKHGTRSASMSRVRPYALAVALTALGFALAFAAGSLGAQKVEFPMCLMAVGAAVWYAGTGPGAVAGVLATLGFDFFFTEPLYSLAIRGEDQIYFAVFVIFAVMIGWFANRRRRIEHDLRRARDELQKSNAAL